MHTYNRGSEKKVVVKDCILTEGFPEEMALGLSRTGVLVRHSQAR